MISSILAFVLMYQPEHVATGGGGGGAAGGCAGGEGGLMNFAFLPLMLVVFYFLLIRPQQKQQREFESLQKSLGAGDKVRTSGGILGEVVAVRERDMDLLVADRVKINVLRSHIAGKEVDPKAAKTDAKDAKK